MEGIEIASPSLIKSKNAQPVIGTHGQARASASGNKIEAIGEEIK